MGRTPWSARDAPVPLPAQRVGILQVPARPTRASAAVQGDRPTLSTNAPDGVQRFVGLAAVARDDQKFWHASNLARIQPGKLVNCRK